MAKETLTIEEYKVLAKIYNTKKTDLGRLEFLKRNNKTFKAVLDNDQTQVCFITDGMDEDFADILNNIELKEFDEYHYWSEGCLLLFKFAGITAESC